MYGAETMFDDSRCDNGHLLLTNCLVRMGYRAWMPRYHSSLSREHLVDKPIFKWKAQRHVHSQIFNYAKLNWLPVRTKRRFVYRSCTSSFIALRKFGTDWFLIFVGHFLRKKVLLIVLRPALVSRRHMCEFNRLELISTWTFVWYIGFSKSATLADVSWKGHSFASTTSRVAQHASHLLLILVVRRMRCQLWDGLTLKSLLGFYPQSLCLRGVCWTSLPPTRPRSFVFRRVPDLVFACSRLLCRLGGKRVSIWVAVISPHSWVYWRRFTVCYCCPWLRNMDIGPF